MSELPFFSPGAIIIYAFVLFSIVLGFILTSRPVREHKKKFFLKSVLFYWLFIAGIFLYEGNGWGQLGIIVISVRTFVIFFPIFALIIVFL